MQSRPVPVLVPFRRFLPLPTLVTGMAGLIATFGLRADEPRPAPPAPKEAPAEGRAEGPREGAPPRPEGAPREGERPRPDGAPDRGPGDGPRREGAEGERRLRALHQAAEILQEAGLHPQAMALREQAERMMQEFRGQPRGEGGPRPPLPGGDFDSLRREMAELREIVEDLRRQLRGGPEGAGPREPREPREGERPRPEGAPEGGPDRERERGEGPRPEGAPREGGPERR